MTILGSPLHASCIYLKNHDANDLLFAQCGGDILLIGATLFWAL